MASTVKRFSQRNPVTRIIGYFFLLPVFGATTALALSDPTDAIGHRPSIRAIRATRTAVTSIQAVSAGTTTADSTAYLSVLSQNKLRVALPSAVAKRQTVGMQGVSPDPRQNLGEADKIAMTCINIF